MFNFIRHGPCEIIATSQPRHYRIPSIQVQSHRSRYVTTKNPHQVRQLPNRQSTECVEHLLFQNSHMICRTFSVGS